MQEKMKILFATDFGAASKVALHAARVMAKIYDAKVSLAHVLSHFWRFFISPAIYEKEAMQRLSVWQERINPNDRDPHQLKVLVGNAADMILQEAERENPDLILLGAESVESKETFIGSTTAEAVVRHAKHSVWLAKKTRIKRVICGIDLSDSSSDALTEAIQICRRFTAELCIVRVLPQFNSSLIQLDADEAKEIETKYKADQINKVEEFLKSFDCSGLEVNIQYLWGVPSRVILNVADDFDFDLIIIGATGESLLKQVLIGSTAEKLLRQTPCSLLVVRKK